MKSQRGDSKSQVDGRFVEPVVIEHCTLERWILIALRRIPRNYGRKDISAHPSRNMP